jgi:hypothetical protein
MDILSFRELDCDTNHYSVVERVRDRLSERRPTMPKFDKDGSNDEKPNKVED